MKTKYTKVYSTIHNIHGLVHYVRLVPLETDDFPHGISLMGDTEEYFYDKEDARKLAERVDKFLLTWLESEKKKKDFNGISDLRPHLLTHPDQQMVLTSCLHYLGDDAQKWWNEKHK